MPFRSPTRLELIRQVFSRREDAYALVHQIPVAVDFIHGSNAAKVSIERETLKQRQSELPVKGAKLKIDPAALLDVFQRVRTLEEAATFLEICGPFSERPRIFGGPRRLGEEALTWQEFQRWQKMFRNMRLRVDEPELMDFMKRWPEEERLAILSPRPAILYGDVRLGRPSSLRIASYTAMETIAGVVAFDFLRNARPKVCALKTCGALFEPATAHDTDFCCSGHLRQAAQQERRLREKNAAAQERRRSSR